MKLLFYILLFIRSSAWSSDMLWHSVQVHNNNLNIKIQNLSDQDLICSLSYHIRVENKTSGVESYYSYSLNAYKFEKNINLQLFTRGTDITKDTNIELVSVNPADQKMKCISYLPNIETDRLAVESSLRNNHLELAESVYKNSKFKKDIRLINLANSYFTDYESLTFLTSVNHIEFDNSKTELIENSKLVKSIECGLEYITKRSALCSVESYLEGRSAHCGVEKFKLKRSSYCGCQHRTGNSLDCIDGCDCQIWKECRHKNHGIELYKMCRSTKHGIEEYKMCANREHGINNAKICELEK